MLAHSNVFNDKRAQLQRKLKQLKLNMALACMFTTRSMVCANAETCSTRKLFQWIYGRGSNCELFLMGNNKILMKSMKQFRHHSCFCALRRWFLTLVRSLAAVLYRARVLLSGWRAFRRSRIYWLAIIEGSESFRLSASEAHSREINQFEFRARISIDRILSGFWLNKLLVRSFNLSMSIGHSATGFVLFHITIKISWVHSGSVSFSS